MNNVDTSMRALTDRYSIREGVVYWRSTPVTDADSASFQSLGGDWAVDRKFVFVQTTKKKIDRGTFRYLNPLFVVDCKAVYDWKGPIKGADPATFEALDPGVKTEWDILQETWNVGYGRDAKQVFHHDQMFGRATVVRGADPATFRSLRNGYGIDQESVFFDHSRLKRADPSSWFFLGRGYSADKQRVFYFERELVGVDRLGFTVVGLPMSANYATDGNRWFQNDVEIPAKKFLEHFESTIEVLGKWFVNNPLMQKGRGQTTS